MTYSEWINANVPKAYGKCEEVTKQMAKVFPELIRVRGHYYCIAWGERTHWWLTSPEGKIIDPTASQFPSKGKGKYIAWNEGDKEPTGRCPNCGELCFDSRTCCSDKCHNEYVAYVMNPF